MADSLDISNVISVADIATPATLGPFNTANLAVFTHEKYGDDFGSDPYKVYLTASEVAADFGTSSMTGKIANAVFAQSPNILTANGYLAVIPLTPASNKITFSAVPTEGAFTVYYGTDTSKVSSSIAYNDDADAVQTAIRTIPALANATVTGDFEHGFVVVNLGDTDPTLTVSSNTLAADAAITITFTKTAIETIAEALVRTKRQVQYCGTLASRILGQTELLAAAATIEPDYKLGYFPGTDPADIEVGGKLDLLRSGGFHKTRGLYYGLSEEGALLFAAAYASRGHCINFSGNNTVITMNLKDLNTILPDTTLTQTLKVKAENCGADVYANIEGLSKTLSFGANEYWDSQFCKIWFLKKLAIDCFNYLNTPTKIPMTDAGADGFTNICRKVCAQAVTAGYAAPGEWTIADTFGDPETFKQNIREQGYFCWHPSVASMSAAERETRTLLCQVALKESGAVHKANILVTINK